MNKRLYKSRNDVMLDGVCGGIAEYFDLDPTLVRIGWLIAFFCAGTGLLAYFIAMAIMPAKTYISY